MTIASLDDVAVDFGPIDAEQAEQVTVLLERAEARIRQAVPDLDARLADGRTDNVLVRQVEAEMVAAVLRNPGGYVSSTSSRTSGPYSETSSGTLSTTLASGLLRLTNAQRTLLGAPAGAFTITPGSGAGPPRVFTPQQPEWIPPSEVWW